ncbi:MAG: histidine kinase [Flavobacteriales bacterium]|nr:histidine kinase [Flavobacteriales bacterium]
MPRRFSILSFFAIAMGVLLSAKSFASDTSQTVITAPADVIEQIQNAQTNNEEITLSDGSGLTIALESATKEIPFYEQTWFGIVALTVVGYIIYLLFRFFLDRSRKNALAEARISQLERSALQAQMNPHFIFNSLNSIQSYIANNENDKANRFLAKFARLIRSMLNHSRAQKISLNEEIDSLRLYLDLEKMRFKSKFDYEIVVDEDIDDSDIMLPPLLIQPYLENAIIHGLAQKRSQGKVTLLYLLVGKYLVVTVTDNGIGIEKSKSQKGQNTSLHKSVGMTITQKRLEMLDEGNKDKKVDIKEVKDRHGEVLGTKVEVKIRVD